MVIVVMDYGGNMNKFYRKAKPETMKQNRYANKNIYSNGFIDIFFCISQNTLSP